MSKGNEEKHRKTKRPESLPSESRAGYEEDRDAVYRRVLAENEAILKRDDPESLSRLRKCRSHGGTLKIGFIDSEADPFWTESIMAILRCSYLYGIKVEILPLASEFVLVPDITHEGN